MNHHGEILLNHLKTKKIKKSAFVKVIGIHRQTLFMWSEKAKFNDKIYDQIIGKYGITREMFTSPEEKEDDLQKQIHDLRKIVIDLQATVLKLMNK